MERSARQLESVESHLRGLEATMAAASTQLENTSEQVERLKEELGLTGQLGLPLGADSAQRARDAEWDTPAPGADSAREPVKESIDAGVRPRAAALLHRAETAIHAETKGNAIAAIRELRRVFGIGE